MTTVVYLQNGLCPQHRRVLEVAPSSVAALAPGWQTPYVAFVNGRAVLRADWIQTLDDDATVAFVDAAMIPQGGGGGSDPLRTVMMLAVMVYAPQMGALLGSSAMGGAVLGLSANVWTAGLMFAGMSLVNAIAPPPKPTTPQQAAALASPSPTYTLAAQGNTARLDAAIPEHFGYHVAYPDFAAQPYAEYSGNEQYLFQLLCIGRGRYLIDAIRIEDTPITSFEDITYEVIAPGEVLTLFPSAVVTSIEVAGQELLTSSLVGPFVASNAGQAANYLGVDFVCSRGLYYANDNGSLSAVSVTVQIEAQLVDDSGVAVGSWDTLATKTYSAATTTPQRYSERFAVAAGRYHVRITRTDSKQTNTRYGHEIAWSGLRSYLPDTRTFGDVTLLAMRMKATNNLSSQASRKVNVLCTRMLPTWTGSAWTALTATRSPAWALAYACKQVGLTDAQIDLTALATLDATCAARGDTFDARFDSFVSWWEAATKIAQSVRAKPFLQGGVLRVVRDQAASIPVALFSQRNIVRGSFMVNYLMPTDDTADSVDVKYFDSITWAQATVRATLAGSTALRPAKVELFGVTSRAHAWREGLYQAACNRFRRKIISFETEMEGFIPSFGDLIAIQHDMPAWGQSAEVAAWDASTRTLTLSEPVTFTTGNHYIGLRKRDGGVSGPYLVVAGAQPDQVVLSTAPDITPYTGMNEERTHVAFGPGISWRQPARVLSAKPQSLTRVAIEAVNEDDSVHTADVGVIMPVQVFSQLAGYTNKPVVTGLAARFMFNHPNMAVASWAPTPWADHYVVEQSSDGLVWTSCGTTFATSTSFVAAYGSTTLVRVAAIALARGPWLQTSVAVVPPFDPAGLTCTQEISGLRIKWDERLEVNFYELRVGNSWEASALISPVTGTEYLWAPQDAGTYTLRLKSIDVNGNYSAGESTLSVAVAAPAEPLVGYALSGPDEVLSWSIPASGFAVDRYELRYGTSWAAASHLDTTKATSYRRKVDYSGARTYWVAAIDSAGNVGSSASVTATITAPGAPTAPRADVIDNNALLYWGAPASGSLPVDRYDVRKGATWGAGQVIGSNGNSTFATVFEQQAGTYTYWIAAVDSAGTAGQAVSVVANINQPPDYVLRASIDSTFAGTKVNALLTAGKLLLPVNTTETWAQHFTNNGYATPQAQINAGNPIYIQPSTTSASYTESIDYGSVLPATNIVATLNSTLLAGTVNVSCQISYKLNSGDAWTHAPAGATSCLAVNFRYVQVVYTFTATAGPNLLRLDALNIKLSIKSRSDGGSGTVSNAATGVWVPFGYPFIDADTPMVQAQGAVPLIPVVDYADTANPTGFTVYLYTLAGVKTTGSFSWSVKGF